MEEVRRIRELESAVLGDSSQLRNVQEMLRALRSTDPVVALAALHSLRRVFLHLLEADVFACLASAQSRKPHQWLSRHLEAFKAQLLEWVRLGSAQLVAPSVRSLVELVKRDHMRTGASPYFGYATYLALVRALLQCEALDVDVLLMVRAEVFSLSDCTYYALRAALEVLAEHRSEGRSDASVLSNTLDLLRVIAPHEDTSSATRLVPASTGDGGEGGPGDVSESEEEEEEEGGVEEARPAVRTGKRGRAQPAAHAKRVRAEAGDARSQRRLFGKAWVCLLSFPLSVASHTLVLRHLPAQVIPAMTHPLRLADYLTRCYELGGALAVLALESLFVLIAQHNLDYPRFFVSLYRLCSTDMLAARHKARFLRLLSLALKSTNIPAYTAAAFIKRLMHLALHAPTPAARYCLAQVFRLMQAHPQCLALVHRSEEGAVAEVFNASEEERLEDARALQSSLWEAEALLAHHCHQVRDLAARFKETLASASDVRKVATFDAPEDHLGDAYADLIAEELAARKNGALAFAPPAALFPPGSLMSDCFC